MFKLSGEDILVVPNKYVSELRNMPDEIVSSIQANIDVGQSGYSSFFGYAYYSANLNRILRGSTQLPRYCSKATYIPALYSPV
jgi:hypothetical protein